MDHSRKTIRLLLLAISWLLPCGLQAAEPYADTHVHFNWDQKEIISAAEVVNKLRVRNAEFVVVAGTPSNLALELAAAGGDFIIPIFSPYTHVLGKQDWYRNEVTLKLAEQGLKSGEYKGIGEVHFMSGFRPYFTNDIFLQLLRLAQQYDVPILIHVDSADASRFIGVCSKHPKARIMFAHAGGNLKPVHIREVIAACPNVAIELSARDPWRYGALTDDNNTLLPGWRDVIIDHPDRFIIGTDPVWRVTRTQAWDMSDDGWDYYEQILDWFNVWLADLPADIQRKLRLDNARLLFGR